MLIKITPEEVLKCRGISNHLDDIDMIYMGDDRHICVVAVSQGCHVCWACGEPFNPQVPALTLLEKRVDNGAVPVGIHYKCFDPKARKPFSDLKPHEPLPTVAEASRGLQLRKQVAKATKTIFGL